MKKIAYLPILFLSMNTSLSNAQIEREDPITMDMHEEVQKIINMCISIYDKADKEGITIYGRDFNGIDDLIKRHGKVLDRFLSEEDKGKLGVTAAMNAMRETNIIKDTYEKSDGRILEETVGKCRVAIKDLNKLISEIYS